MTSPCPIATSWRVDLPQALRVALVFRSAATYDAFGGKDTEPKAIVAVPRTLLLVDDNIDLLSAMQAVLEKRGYRVVTAPDGRTGLAAAEREAPDLVVVDMLMPHQNGFSLLERLKARPFAQPRVIMITATEGSRYRTHAEELGVDDYLQKPFDMEHLLARIERLCPPEEMLPIPKP